MTKPLAALAGLALAASLLVACSGDPEPADASGDVDGEAFCAPIDDFLAEMYAHVDEGAKVHNVAHRALELHAGLQVVDGKR